MNTTPKIIKKKTILQFQIARFNRSDAGCIPVHVLSTSNNIVQNQVNFVIINQTFRSSISNSKYALEQMLYFHLRLKLMKSTTLRYRIDIKQLKNRTTTDVVQMELYSKLQQIDEVRISVNKVSSTWEETQKIMNESTEKHLMTRLDKKKEGMTTEILN